MENKINFLPWIGKEYSKNGFNGKKIMILGESHHCDSNLAEGGICHPKCKRENFQSYCPDFTKDVLTDYLSAHDGSGWHNTFLCFERNLFNKDLSKEEAASFWNSVIFYNYIQFALPEARVQPDSDMWKESEEAFKQVLEEYMPDYIIAWGIRLFGNLPSWNSQKETLNADEHQTEVIKYTIKDKVIPVLEIIHPSIPDGKNRDKWHKLYTKFLESIF